MSSVSELEISFRNRLKEYGLRFGCNDSSLPGTPDIVFPSKDAVVFVHGCYWHRHNCPGSEMSSTNVSGWLASSNDTVQRDAEAKRNLEEDNWKVLILWECEINADPDNCVEQVRQFLGT